MDCLLYLAYNRIAKGSNLSSVVINIVPSLTGWWQRCYRNG